VRAAAIALAALALGGNASADPRLAFLRGGDLVVLDLATRGQHVALARAPVAPIAWSGDGRLLSIGGRVVGGSTLSPGPLAWAPTGETAAYQTASGAVELWSPGRGSRAILAASWGATSVAWGANGELVLGRGPRDHHDVWLWNDGRLTRVAVAHDQYPRPIAAGVDGVGRALWWDDPWSSGSIAADGIPLLANGRRLAKTLVFSDYVAVCGTHVALAAGRDRYTTHGKRILFDGRDVSRDASLSWVSPSCNTRGLLVAAAGRNWVERRIGKGERRSIWELAPQRVRLTYPPAGWTDENPRVLADGSILFVRTRETSVKLPGHTAAVPGGRTTTYVEGGWRITDHGRIELISHGRVTWIASTSWSIDGFGGSYTDHYGHYGWPWLVAVTR
jgi:hypothetical protein